MTSMIYTKNTSGAIRRLRNKKPTKGYLSALLDHIKFLKSLGFKFDDVYYDLGKFLHGLIASPQQVSAN